MLNSSIRVSLQQFLFASSHVYSCCTPGGLVAVGDSSDKWNWRQCNCVGLPTLAVSVANCAAFQRLAESG